MPEKDEDREELLDEAIETVTNLIVGATEMEDDEAERLAKKIVRRVDAILSEDEEGDDGDEEEDPV